MHKGPLGLTSKNISNIFGAPPAITLTFSTDALCMSEHSQHHEELSPLVPDHEDKGNSSSGNMTMTSEFLTRDYGVPSLSDKSEFSLSTLPHMKLSGMKRVTLQSIVLDVIDNANHEIEHQKTLNQIKYHRDHASDQPCETCFNLSELYFDTCSSRWRRLTRRNDVVLVNKTGEHKITRLGSFYRDRFEEKLRLFGFTIQKLACEHCVYTVVGGHFERLGRDADVVGLALELNVKLESIGLKRIEDEVNDSLWEKFQEFFESDQEVDYISAPFRWDKRHLFAGIDDPDTFFRSALRSFLTHHILIRTDVSKKKDISDGINIRGLNYLVHKGVYTDVFILHDRPSTLHRRLAFKSKDDDTTIVDPRQELWDSWKKWYKFQPLWKIRNYFGEKIAFYFAWIGLYTASLIVPTILGIISLIYGISYDIDKLVNLTAHDNDTESSVTGKFYQMFTTFNNPITPWFSLVLCLWGTIFVEQWKRKSNSLKYEWDVSNFEQLEPDRPQFYGIHKRNNPITNEEEWYYPFYRMYLKLSISVTTVLFMVIIVIGTTIGIILFRCASTNGYWFASEEFTNKTIWSVNDNGVNVSSIKSVKVVNYNSVYSSFISSVLNAICIMILGRVYEYLAYWLTDWENHRTQTGYDDALIMKLFAFQFVNNYASLFYIAFFKESAANTGMFDNSNWKDECDYRTASGNISCMPMLVMQVAVLLILKPMPKFFNDVIIPYLIQKYRVFKRRFKAGDSPLCCCPPCCCSCVRGDIEKIDEGPQKNKELIDIIEEDRKLIAGDKDFTLSEYTEKCIMYGIVMLFGAAFPLAPLVALICNMVDVRIDAHRILWKNRRYIAQRAEDIGIWQYILEFLNMVGVVNNSLIIAFTMDGNGSFTDTIQIFKDNPWLTAFAFEHLVFTIKFIVAYVIPDIPSDVRFKMRKEQYQVNMLFDDSLRKDVKAEHDKQAAAEAAVAADAADKGNV